MSYVDEMYITKIGVPYEKVAMTGHLPSSSLAWYAVS